MSGYPSTVILEANRRSSEEYKAGNKTNPALFTNKVNDGIRVNTGDVISVHSAYISELGAEGSEIEIKGISLNKSKTVTITETTHQSNTSYTNPVFGVEGGIRTINGNVLNSLQDKSVKVDFRDDTINMVVSPYKNANGEHYISLPWNYAINKRTGNENATAWFDPQPSIDRVYSGAGGFIGVFGNASSGNITLSPHDKSWNRSDRRNVFPSLHNASKSVAIKNDNSRYAIFQIKDVIHSYGTYEDQRSLVNSTAREGIVWGYDSNGNSIAPSNASYLTGDRQDKSVADPVTGVAPYRDIALQPYKRVRHLISASANLGYNSPSDVSEKLTEDILRTENIQRTILMTDNEDDALVDQKRTSITTTAENQANRLYKCASPYTYTLDNASDWNNWDATPTDDVQLYDYIAAHETIGVKRPDLFEKGREYFPPHGFTVAHDYQRDSTTKLLDTNIPWTDENLSNISDLISAEQRYPELLDSDNINTEDRSDLLPASETFSIKDNLWFLHINISASNSSTLGYDLSDQRATYFVETARQTTQQPSASMCTAPIWFNFNPTTRGMNASQISGGDFENAVFGFAVKRTNASLNEFISFKVAHTYKQYTQSGQWFVGSPHPVLDYIPEGVRLGWDYHFTAYGCPCMLLWNGMNGSINTAYQLQGLSMTPQGEIAASQRTVANRLTLGDKVPEIYIGAPDLSLAFNQDQDRFEFRNFHNSETEGNVYNAGYQAQGLYQVTNASGIVTFENPDSVAVPMNPQSAQKVYKINKQLLKNNWTPCMTPYFNEIRPGFFTRFTAGSGALTNASYTAKQSFVWLNEAFSTNEIFDATTGLFVTDWIVDEESWDDTLWGIMGFQYSQTRGEGGNQTRVINSNNWSSMAENTTNADITNADYVLNLTRNQFGAPNYNLTPPTATQPFSFPITGNASHRFLPSIVIPQDNGQPLRALNIPTRTLRPYYTIRSNIISAPFHYFGGSATGVALPVVAVVDKVSNSGDFFNIDASQLQFTVTQPYTISDIRTSIHDPDGSYSKLSANTAVLYSIQRTIKADTNPVTTILESYKSKLQQQQFEEELAAPEPTKKDVTDVVNMMVVSNKI